MFDAVANGIEIQSLPCRLNKFFQEVSAWPWKRADLTAHNPPGPGGIKSAKEVQGRGAWSMEYGFFGKCTEEIHQLVFVRRTDEP